MVRQARLIAITGVFLMACAVALVVVGCAGVRSGAPPKEDQGHIETTKEGHEHSEATPSEEARCEDTRTFHVWYVVYPNGQNSSLQSGSTEDMKKAGKRAGKVEEGGVVTTNDLPGCSKGGLLLGTDKSDKLDGQEGDDEIRGLGAADLISGGWGSDVIYGGAGNDELRANHEQGQGEGVLYGGDGNDFLVDDDDGQRGKLYCGKGKDQYVADKIDYVDSSCEKTPSGQGA